MTRRGRLLRSAGAIIGTAVLVFAVLAVLWSMIGADPATSLQALGDPTPQLAASQDSQAAGVTAVRNPTTPSSSPQPTAGAPGNPTISEIGDRQWRRMVRTGTWRPECPVGRDDLRRLEIDHVTFDGTVKRGVIVAHRDSIEDLAEIFGKLFEQGFPIERMTPVERFDGEVNRSLAANNTSAFNCRKPGQINAPVKDSPHANGRAIDINPVQNPWRDPRCKCWNPVGDKGTRKLTGPGVIRKGSPVIDLFEGRGWIWQNIDVADYMHFDTGYPSRPRS